MLTHLATDLAVPFITRFYTQTQTHTLSHTQFERSEDGGGRREACECICDDRFRKDCGALGSDKQGEKKAAVCGHSEREREREKGNGSMQYNPSTKPCNIFLN